MINWFERLFEAERERLLRTGRIEKIINGFDTHGKDKD